MTAYAGLTFAPLIPWWMIAVLAAALLVVVGIGFWRRARGTLLRFATWGSACSPSSIRPWWKSSASL
jgi:hypothetical protein